MNLENNFVGHSYIREDGTKGQIIKGLTSGYFEVEESEIIRIYHVDDMKKWSWEEAK